MAMVGRPAARRVSLILVVLPLLAAGGELPTRNLQHDRGLSEQPGGMQIAAHAATVVHASCVEREPNEQTTQASPMPIPAACTGAVASTDASSIRINYSGGVVDGIEDIFALALPSAAKLTIELSFTTASADLDLFLFRRDGNGSIEHIELAGTDNPGATERIVLSSPLPPGTYYIGVSAFIGSSAYSVTVSAPGFSDTCTPDATSLCLNNGRFRVQTDWRVSDGRSGQGQGVLMTSDTGYFWFFDQSNVEVVLKVLNACSLNDRFWVFSGGLTDVEVRLRITDTVSGATKEYQNPLNTAYRPINDTSAFSTCSGSAPQCSYNVTPTSQQYGAAAGSGTVSVTAQSGCSWTATSSASWLTVTSGASGSGNGTVSYSVAANTGSSSRNGTLNVAGTVVNIAQSGGTAGCTYTVSPTSQSVVAGGGNHSIVMTTQAGCAWTATASASWITITSGSSGTGNGTVTYSVAANAGASRSGSITAGGRTVAISQAGDTSNCSFDVTFTPRPFSWCGGDDSYTVTKADGCAFTATSSASWIIPVLAQSATSGTSSFGSFAVEPNTSGSARTGTITIAGRNYTITQAARSGSGQYDGIWRGTTSNSREISACVAGNSVEMMRITVRLNFVTFGCTTTLVRTAPMAISGSAFTGRLANYPEVSNVFTTVNGTFPSATSMSGSWTPFSESYFIRCGSTIGFGTGGTSLASGTFTATKQ